jgi:tRNA G18 (ribose-2'-O)-methylase SpoU
MDKIKSRPDAPMLQTMLLRSMQQAVYSPDNIGHFGLAYEAYAHFTSPIRRYPDLLVHRSIKAILAHTKYRPAFIQGTERADLAESAPDAGRRCRKRARTLPRARSATRASGTNWVHCSANERRADEASRDVEAWLKCYFMRDKLGSDFAGTISAVTSFGIFVQLDELYVEGLVHVTELGSDYFQYDEARNELRGERTGIRYRLTDRVRVQVSRVDLDARKIDFRLVQEPSAKTLRARAGAPGSRGCRLPMRCRRAEGRQLPALLGGTSKPEESFDETLDRVIEEQPVFEAVITPLKPRDAHVGHTPHGRGSAKKAQSGKPAKRAAKPKPAHLKTERQPTTKRAPKPAGKSTRPAQALIWRLKLAMAGTMRAMAKHKLLIGFHAVNARLRQNAQSVSDIYIEANRRDRRMQDFIRLAESLGVTLHPVDAERLRGMAGTDRHQGVVARADDVSLALNLDELLDGIEGTPLLLVLDGVTDPHNLGACLRVADGAGAHAVIAPKDRSVGLNATVAKVASGAAETVPYITVTNLRARCANCRSVASG